MSDVVSIAAAGLMAHASAFAASAKRVVEQPQADLASQLVKQKLAKYGFQADVAVIRTANEMTKSLLDILA